MKPVKQEDGLGCAVACVAFLLEVPYSTALDLFEDGKIRVKEKANFYCPEIVQILNHYNHNYTWEKLTTKNMDLIDKNYSIVFIKRSKKYPYGHFLCSHYDKWMDPWLNLPDNKIEAGFRNELPGEPTYVIYPS
jgi:hypothetical protein